MQLFDCYDFFSKSLKEKIKTREDVEKVYDRVKNEITFSVTLTDTYEKAIRLFQVLNDNSVKLSAVDLFKNFLLSELGSRPDSELGEFAGKWNNVQAECSTKRASFQDYLLRFSMSRLGYFKHNDLYAKLEKIYKEYFNNDPEDFLGFLEEDICNYLQIFFYDSIEIEKDMFQEVKFFIKIFNSLGANEPLTFFYTLFSVLRANDIKSKNKIIRELFRKFLNFSIVRYKLNGSGRAYMHQVYPSWSQALQNFHWDNSVTIESILKQIEIKRVDEHNLKYFQSKGGKSPIVEVEIGDLTFSSNKKSKTKRN